MKTTAKVMALIATIIFILTGCRSINKQQAEIHWVNFIQLDDINYYADYINNGRILEEGDLNGQYDAIAFKVADNIHDPSYKTQNGDAAFLEKGTPVYKIKGYSPKFRVAAYLNNELLIYEAQLNPKAKTGADFFDIKDKVTYISINSEVNGKTELFSIHDVDKVNRMTDILLNSPVKSNVKINSTERYFLAFHLTDGTAVTRPYWIEENYLSPSILLPEEFKEEIIHAMK